ncbi:MAG: hypothetical protein IJL81_05180, partial [Clostridia bacterium]|nr:hypothetical protein [Clostridia bacterium]
SLNAQIAEINNEISKIEARIEEINVKISNKRDDIQKTIDLLKDRLRAAYMAGGISDIEVLIGSSSL